MYGMTAPVAQDNKLRRMEGIDANFRELTPIIKCPFVKISVN